MNGQLFCNYDYGDDGFCEACAMYASPEDCFNDGLPDKGAHDCRVRCFGGGDGYGGNDDGCEDDPSEWLDQLGDGCDWYANPPAEGEPSNCEQYGHMQGTGGMTANEACCACGGGIGGGGGGCYDDDALLAEKR